MSRAAVTSALAILATILLAGCGASPAPVDAAASDGAAAPSAVESGPAAEPAATDPVETPSAAAGAGTDRAACEAQLLEQYAAWSPRAAADDDIAAAADAMLLVLPGRPTCGVVVDAANGPADQTRVVWLDQPAVAPELVRVLDTRGWASTEDDTAGVRATTYTDGALEVLVAAIGVDNAQAGWDDIWPGIDITLLTVETS